MKMAESKVMQSVRVFFGIFMILLYFGMAALMAINFFGWNSPPFTWLRWVLALIFGLYGVYRGYRQYKGIDYYRIDTDDDSAVEEDNRINELIKKVHDHEEIS